MDIFLSDGLKWLENKTKKIEDALEKKFSSKEGYNGLMGNNDSGLDPTLSSLPALQNNLAQEIGIYNTTYNAFMNKTKAYLGATANNGRNYQLYVNTPITPDPTPYQGGCVTNAVLSSLTNAGERFNSVYPINAVVTNTTTNTTSNFRTAAAAISACNLWAADNQTPTSGTNPTNTYFAVTKNDDGIYSCYTGSSLAGATLTPANKKKTAYVVATSGDATHGGLFGNGTVGVYNSVSSSSSVTNPNNIVVNPNVTVPAGYSKCNSMLGGSLNPNSIIATLGNNCSNTTTLPVKIRYVIIKPSQDTSNTDRWINFSQLIVKAYVNGRGQVVSIKGSGSTPPKANSGGGTGIMTDAQIIADTTSMTAINNGENQSNPNIAIDGIANSSNSFTREWPSIYHSATNSMTEWWKLDLGQEKLVYEIIFYNRPSSPQRSNGMTMQFYDNNGGAVLVKNTLGGASTNKLTFNSSLVQSFLIAPPS